MIIFTIILGFNLPSAMGVYWFIGAIISILTSVIMHFIFTKKKDLN
jgi:membrane protein insertase Oxa1/YidC/SpoIIIJ